MCNWGFLTVDLVLLRNIQSIDPNNFHALLLDVMYAFCRRTMAAGEAAIVELISFIWRGVK